MAYVRVEQRNAHLAGAIRLDMVNARDGKIAKATLTAISNARRGTGDAREDEATAIQWTLWGKQAENAAEYLGKGSHVNIVGRLRNITAGSRRNSAGDSTRTSLPVREKRGSIARLIGSNERSLSMRDRRSSVGSREILAVRVRPRILRTWNCWKAVTRSPGQDKKLASGASELLMRAARSP